ncbi:MAG: sulfotransferase [Polyangiaceae bacterium]|nr:sulfotransferase [Polyangiaceae bacterium]
MHVFMPLYFRAPLGGLQAHVRAQALALCRAGHRCTVMCKPGPFAEDLLKLDVPVLTTTFEDVGASVSAAEQAGPYDLVHAHPFVSRQVGHEIARRQAIPFVLTVHGMYTDNLERYADDVDAVIAVSPAIRDFLVAKAACPAARFVILPNGVDMQTFRPDGSDHTAPPLPAGWQGRLDDRRILLVTRLDRDKQFILDVVQETWRHQRESRASDLVWLVAGDGSERDMMEAAARQLDAAAGRKVVGFLGWQDAPSLAALYNWAHLAIAPGRSALEAMACARAVIAVGSKAYVGLIDGSTALSGAYQNFGGVGSRHDDYPSRAMYRDLDRVVYDDHALAELGDLGRSLCAALFDQHELDAHLLRLYDVVVRAKPRTATRGAWWRPLATGCAGFSQPDRPGMLSAAWHSGVGQDRAISVSSHGRLLVRCALDEGGKFYVRSGAVGLDHPPSDPQAWAMQAEGRYRFELCAALDGDVNVQAWVIQYDAARRLERSVLRLRSGENRMEVRASPATTAFRLAFRFAGTGTVELGPLLVFHWTGEPQAAGSPESPRRNTQARPFHEYDGENLVFIVGPPRSGTTWLLQLLACHPDVVAADVDNLDARINDRRTLETNIFNDTRPFTDNQIRSKFHRLSCRHSGTVVVEKTPIHLLYMDRIRRVFPKAAFVLALRDGRDAVTSLVHVGTSQDSWWSGAPATVKAATKLWTRYADAAVSCLRGTTPPVVRYEALLRNTHAELQRLLEIVGLSTSHIGAQVEACRGGRNIPIPGVFRRGEAGEWRAFFRECDLQTFAEIAGAAQVALGYEVGWTLPSRGGQDE